MWGGGVRGGSLRGSQDTLQENETDRTANELEHNERKFIPTGRN